MGDTAAQRPQSITVNLLADGEIVKSQTISANANGEWTYIFENLPVYAGANKIVYTVTENPVEHYTTAVDGFNITNTYSAPEPSGSGEPTPTPNPSGTTDPLPTPKPSDTTDPIPTPKPGESTGPAPTAAPTLIPEYDDGVWNPDVSPKTADAEPLLLWIGLMAVCTVLVSWMLHRKKA